MLIQYDLQNAAKVVFKTGQFDDIQVGRDGNTLILSIIERPSIASIELDGNKALKTEELMKGLNEAGLAEGQVFKRSILEWACTRNTTSICFPRQVWSIG